MLLPIVVTLGTVKDAKPVAAKKGKGKPRSVVAAPGAVNVLGALAASHQFVLFHLLSYLPPASIASVMCSNKALNALSATVATAVAKAWSVPRLLARLPCEPATQWLSCCLTLPPRPPDKHRIMWNKTLKRCMLTEAGWDAAVGNAQDLNPLRNFHGDVARRRCEYPFCVQCVVDALMDPLALMSGDKKHERKALGFLRDLPHFAMDYDRMCVSEEGVAAAAGRPRGDAACCDSDGFGDCQKDVLVRQSVCVVSL